MLNNLKRYQLLEFNCPHMWIYEDKELYNQRANVYSRPQDDSTVSMFPYNYTKDNCPSEFIIRISFGKLWRYYFDSPWGTNIEYRYLNELGYSNYFATIDGRIYSCYNYKYMTPYVDKDGYFVTSLYNNNGNHKYVGFHRIVARAFIVNPKGLPMVNHIDGNKQNNYVYNLEWVTDFQNKQHARNLGLLPKIVTELEVNEICKLLEKGHTQNYIGKLLNINPYIVKNIRKGSGWRHVSKNYNIPNSWKRYDPYIKYGRKINDGSYN